MNLPNLQSTPSPLAKRLRKHAVGLVLRALLIAAAYWAAHLLGWRNHTAFLSGTTSDTALSLTTVTRMGVIYMALYFAWLLLAPILAIAAVILGLLSILIDRRGNPPGDGI
jgi:hypothetical protein